MVRPAEEKKGKVDGIGCEAGKGGAGDTDCAEADGPRYPVFGTTCHVGVGGGGGGGGAANGACLVVCSGAGRRAGLGCGSDLGGGGNEVTDCGGGTLVMVGEFSLLEELAPALAAVGGGGGGYPELL